MGVRRGADVLVFGGVLVHAALVGSSGFRARVGEKVTLGLQVYCRRRSLVVAPQERDEPVQPGPAGELGLTGIVLPHAASMLGGWVLEVAGIPVHVEEAPAGRAPGVIVGRNDRRAASDPVEPLPGAGTWVRVTGPVSVADDYETEDAEQAWLMPMRRPWLVRRIVRRTPAGQALEAGAIVHTGDTSDYLIDLAGTGHADLPGPGSSGTPGVRSGCGP
ncbi:hypothetical protein AB0G04_05345 [Actinoplanes sp. NPDC023801]|uniref:hypothetical protein n=1 Tax=Actinoplanes sp. NPDC023801 TaxID=3154595 RepID=UPI0033F6D5E5